MRLRGSVSPLMYGRTAQLRLVFGSTKSKNDLTSSSGGGVLFLG
jgi:hypothetical protein